MSTPFTKTDEPVKMPKGSALLDPAMARRNPLRLLLAEDHIINQRVAQKMLAQMGYGVTIVTDGLQAVEAVKAAEYDVILMDVDMPGMTGIEATAEIRKLNVQQPCIIAVTAASGDDNRRLCLQAGMNHFLGKPLDPSALRNLLLAAASRRAAPKPCIAPDTIQTLRASCSNNPDLLHELFEAYFSEARKSVAQIALGIAKQDSAVFKRAVHQLKGSSRMIGIHTVGDLCVQLESTGTAELQAAQPALKQLEQALQQAEEAALRILHSADSPYAAGL